MKDIDARARAIIDTLIPADEWRGGWDGGVSAMLASGDLPPNVWPARSLDRLGIALDAIAVQRHGKAFAELPMPDRTAVFGVAANRPGLRADLEDAVSAVDRGFYAGSASPEGWAMVGFDPGPTAEGISAPTGLSPREVADEYDVIVIGAGAGGGVVASERASRGDRVLLIDRSRPMTTAELRGDHLRGKRMQVFDVTAGAGSGSPRVFENADGSTRLLPGEGDGGAYGLNAMTLGGGTRLWQGMSWRFYDEDFRMASTYGVPDGSTLADWPFGYEELAPYYDRVERALGVSGDATSPMTQRTPRSRPFPMPAMPEDDVRRRFGGAARALGWSTSPIPLAINSVPRHGRAACVRCAQCIGHACPVDAKNGTHNTYIPSALATGNCDLLLSTQAVEIVQGARGVATGVRMVIESPVGHQQRLVRARSVVVAAGAIETARLLLASGLGNEWVGRNHHNHGLAGAIALSGPTRESFRGPGHSVATVDWVHRDGEGWGGGVIFDAAPMYPLQRARFGRQLPGLGWGLAHKEWMRASGPLLGTRAMVQEIPDASARVRLDPEVRDRWGMPVARVSGTANAASREAVDYLAPRCVEWLESAGGEDIVPQRFANEPQGAEHSAGTVRLAEDPAKGACDPRGLLFGTRNVYVADASLNPTNGGFNPGLTIMANALRVADLLG